jgi:DNA modification methylase
MTTNLEHLINQTHNEDCLETMQRMPDGAIDLTFTSPPYFNARDYSQYASYGDYLESMRSVFKEVHRVTSEGRFLVINTSPVIEPRLSRAHSSKRYPIPYDLHGILTELGWEFTDDIVWVKPEASVKNRIGGFYQHRKPLGYKPNAVTEMLMVYRKQTDRLIDWNMKKYRPEIVKASLVADGYESTNVWHIAPKSSKKHSAIFPETLADRVISYYSYVGDVVYDPFMGSGTTGKMAQVAGRHYIGSEISTEYVAIADGRINSTTTQTTMSDPSDSVETHQ